VLTETEGVGPDELAAIDARVTAEIDRATDEAEASPAPEALDALEGVYADPARMPVLWYREGMRSAVDRHERPSSWGTHDG
jgi:TPP-dependent pyruvate/acetoin dehydrogenase alpha subunit